MKKKIALIMSVIMLFSLFSMNMGISAQASTQYEDGTPYYAVFDVDGSSYYCEQGTGTDKQLDVAAPYSEKIAIEAYDKQGNVITPDSITWSVDDVEGVKIEDTGTEYTVLSLDDEVTEEYLKVRCVVVFANAEYVFGLICHNTTVYEGIDNTTIENTTIARDPVLTGVNYDHCAFACNWAEVPYGDQTKTFTFNLRGYDQWGHYIRGLNYSIYYGNPGNPFPQGMTLTGGTNGQFSLLIDSSVAEGIYTITIEASDGISRTVSDTITFTLYRSVCNMDISWFSSDETFGTSPIRIATPSTGNTRTLYAQITAYDIDGNETPCQTYALSPRNSSNQYQGITINDLGNGLFEVVIDSSVSGGWYSFDYEGCKYGVQRLIMVSAFTVYQTTLSTIAVNLSKYGARLTNYGNDTVIATVTAYDQWGLEMTTGLQYSVSGLPSDASVSWSGNIATIEIGPNNSSGAYRLTFSVSDGTKSETRMVYINLYDPQLKKCTVSLSNTTVPVPTKGYETVTVTVTAYDHWGQTDWPGVNYSLSGLPNGVRILSQSGNVFTLAVDSTAKVGKYTITGTANYRKYGNVTKSSQTTLTLSTPNLVLNSAVVLLSSGKCPLPRGMRTNRVMARIIGYDQYGAEMSPLSYTIDAATLPAGITAYPMRTDKNGVCTDGVFTLVIDSTAKKGINNIIGTASTLDGKYSETTKEDLVVY